MPFIWVGGSEVAIRVYEGWADGRQLYMRLDDGNYLFAGHLYRRCGECGVIVRDEAGPCELCGSPLIPLHP